MPQKRTQAVSAPVPSEGKNTENKHTKSSKAKSKSVRLASSSGADNSPPTPALTPSSSTTPPNATLVLADNANAHGHVRSTRKMSKALRGHHHGNGGHGGHHGPSGKGTMKRRRAVGGPEAELSGEEDDDEDEKGEEQEGEAGEEDTSEEEKEEVVVVLGGSEERKKNTLVPVSVPVPVREVSMGALLDGAKLKPESQNISRGYELITSPASRLIIPFDVAPSIPATTAASTRSGKPFAARTTGMGMGNVALFGGHTGHGVGSTPSSPGFSDDVEWEWEDLCFEMDTADMTSSIAAVIGPASSNCTTKPSRDAYAEVVKRVALI